MSVIERRLAGESSLRTNFRPLLLMEEVFCGTGGGFLLGFAPVFTTGLVGLLGRSSKLICMPKSLLLFDRKVCNFMVL